MPQFIHPTAVVHPNTELGQNVHIGPYCVIHEHVQLGDDCWLQNHVTIAGPTKIGKRNRFYCGGSIGQQTQDLKYSGEPTYLEIGDDNTFREYVTIHRGTAPEARTRIGNHGNFLSYTHIAHDCTVGDHVIFSNNATLAGHVTVEHHAIIGGLTAIHQFCRIGCYSMTGGCAKIVQDIPPYFIADGNPAIIRGVNQIGLQRQGYPEETIKALREAYRLIYRKNLNLSQAMQAIEEQLDPNSELQHLREFIAATSRGIIR